MVHFETIILIQALQRVRKLLFFSLLVCSASVFTNIQCYCCKFTFVVFHKLLLEPKSRLYILYLSVIFSITLKCLYLQHESWQVYFQVHNYLNSVILNNQILSPRIRPPPPPPPWDFVHLSLVAVGHRNPIIPCAIDAENRKLGTRTASAAHISSRLPLIRRTMLECGLSDMRFDRV